MEMIIAWGRFGNIFLSYNKHRKFSWNKIGVNFEPYWVILAFVAWTNNLILGLDLKTKGTEEGAI